MRKVIILSLLYLPVILSAQYEGGVGDGTDASGSTQLDLSGVPIGIFGLYQGGAGDGYTKQVTVNTLSGTAIISMYKGGIGDGFTNTNASFTLSGSSLAQLYGGGDGDGFSQTVNVQTLDGIAIASIYGGGDGDGFSQTVSIQSLGGEDIAGIYGGGNGDGHSTLAVNGALGHLLMLFGGGEGDGFSKNQTAATLDGGAIAAIFNGGNGDGNASAGFAGLAPLPLQLITFDAFPEDTYVLLRWITEDEQNTDFFTIEKTRSGQDFVTVGQTLAAGYSLPGEQLHYEMRDHDPYGGKSYYRLKTTDFDGMISYSHLVEVLYEGDAKWDFVLYPNPNTGKHFNIRLDGSAMPDKVLVEVIDPSGRLLEKQQMTSADEVNYTFQLHNRLSAGTYLIRLSHPEKGQQSKLLIVAE